MPMTQKIIAIVPAAGQGLRARANTAKNGRPKQYKQLKGQAMLRHAVQALLHDQRIQQVCVAVAADDAYVADALTGLPRTHWRFCGAESRHLTVLSALNELALAESDWVLVHDAARPGLPAEALERLIDTCLSQNNGGLLALPIADTVKQQENNGPVAKASKTLPREGLWLAQTPQMFRAGPLKAALQQALQRGLAITDEASALEITGYRPLLVEGSARNFKVTWPDDFTLIEALLA